MTPFVDFGNVWTMGGGRAALRSEYFAVSGIGLRWQYGERWNARLGWGIPFIDIKSGDRSLQERGLYFSVEFKPF